MSSSANPEPLRAPRSPADDAGPAISARGLRCSYGAAEAVRGIDLEVRTGEVFALLGPNGAGKTTTIEVLAGFRAPTAGEALVLGARPARAGRAWRARIGVMLQESRPEPELTVRECLALYAGYHERPCDVQETLAHVGLDRLATRRCERLSGGEQRRLDVALALIGDPELIFLDEPTTGLDPAARRDTWELLASLRTRAKTIVLTTHHMEEAERLADRIAVMSDGLLVASGTPRTLGARELMHAQITFALPDGVGFEELPVVLDALPAPTGEGVLVSAPDPVPALSVLTGWALARDVHLRDLEVRRPSLEDVYLQLTDARSEPIA